MVLNRVMKKILFIIPLVLLLASVPELLAIRQGEIFLDIEAPFRVIKDYLEHLFTGKLFIYRYGDKSWEFFKTFPRYFITTLFYTIVSLAIGLGLGTLSGLYLSGGKRQRLRTSLSFLGNIPDFVLIVILQMIVIFIYQSCGFRISRVATAGDNWALLLPIISLTLFPLIQTMNVVGLECNRIKSKSYILYAKAKGLSHRYIFFRHILPGLFPVLKSDLSRTIGVVIASLFICERLYNITGMTKFLFSMIGYQFHIVVNTILAFILLFTIVYYIFLAILYVIHKVVSHV